MSFSPRTINRKIVVKVKGDGERRRERSDEPLTHGGFVICSAKARNEWGAKIALQIDFELKVSLHK
jgi:hypothetical protein